MPILREKKIVFIHIPKCAGTSIERALGWADRYPNLGRAPVTTEADLSNLFGRGLQHLTALELEFALGTPCFNSCFKFSIIRDPFDRMASHFLWRNYRFQSELPPADVLRTEFAYFVGGVFAKVQSARVFLSPEQGFNQAFLGISGLDFSPNSVDRHLLPQVAFLFSRGSLVADAIYGIHDFRACVADLEARLEKKINVEPLMTTTAPLDYRSLYDASTRYKVARLYTADLGLWDHFAPADAGRSWIPGVGPSPWLFNGVASVSSQGGERLVASSVEPGASVTPSPRSFPEHAVLPERIWVYWDQGWDRAPMIVKRCLSSWVDKNPTWEVHRLDRASVRQHTPDIPRKLFGRGLPIAALSDFIRASLLKRYGGVWADATLWCQVPLNDWIPQTMGAGFFAFEKPAADRPLSSWFLAATTHHYILDRWLEEALSLWLQRGFLRESKKFWPAWGPHLRDRYFWLHRLFQQLIDDDPAVNALWSRAPKISANGPHFLQMQGLGRELSDEARYDIDVGGAPVYKLTRYLSDEDVSSPGTNVGYLVSRFAR